MQYAIAPLFLLGAILVWAPGMIQKPTQRLISINKDFEKEAPFHFKIEADALHVEQNGDFTLEIKIDGSALPADAFIDVDNFQYRLKKKVRMYLPTRLIMFKRIYHLNYSQVLFNLQNIH